MGESGAMLVFFVHAVTTLLMTAVIWFVQIVHYPLFAEVGRATFQRYERAHQRRIARLVIPLMLGELFSSLLLFWVAPPGLPTGYALSGLVLLAVIWLSTAILQVPQHGRLARRGFDTAVHTRLVSGNWLRTIAWTLRALLVCVALWALVSDGAPAAG